MVLPHGGRVSRRQPFYSISPRLRDGAFFRLVPDYGERG